MIEINNNSGAQRYEAVLDGQLAGFCSYTLDGKVITFTHTVVKPEFEGKGVGSALAKQVLDDSHVRGLKVVPVCEFVKTCISRHGEYQDLLEGS